MDRSFVTFVAGAAVVMFGAVWLWSAPAAPPPPAVAEAAPAKASAPSSPAIPKTSVFAPVAPPVVTTYEPAESQVVHKLR